MTFSHHCLALLLVLGAATGTAVASTPAEAPAAPPPAEAPAAATPAEDAAAAIAALVEQLLAAEEHAPALHRPDPAVPFAPERQFRFDWILAHTPQELLDALQHTLKSNLPPAEAEARTVYAREMEARFQAILEYYPLVATTPDDFHALLDTIYNGANPPLLRNFLLRRTAPGLCAGSALSEYMQGMLAHKSTGEAFDRKLADLVHNTTEPPDVQENAIGALGARTAVEYAAILDADPLARAHAADQGTALHARMLIGASDAIPLTPRAQAQLEDQNQAATGILNVLLAVIRDPNRSDSVREAARKTATTIAENYPVPDREASLEKIAATP